ncbi:alcohol dehydrogenase-7 [Coleophoma cylindrospora]|uniref:Alcohol dehydrogenase-7 n=1 Tax=Coleophoma cylindrospora TaxID=1849047 RepID=A0A3D8SGI2_9HELO|nr:alcohol dehydrogenase-7 [Coleophoma cylindrospora]
MVPETARQWSVQGSGSLDNLKFNQQAPVPKLGDYDVLVRFKYASLNFRDLIIPLGQYNLPVQDGVVLGSDGAGIVASVGPKVTRFKPGDGVMTLFAQGFISGELDPSMFGSVLGATADGCLQDYGAFNEQGLVAMPQTLDFQQASTLSCAAVTAWNGLHGFEGKGLKPGQTVLVQGTGGVSLFALQFAKASGATVIATTSTDEKAATLKKLGADHVINYKTDVEWAKTARSFTPNHRGVDHIIEVGGPTTMGQSLNAIRIGGVISVIGFVGGAPEKQPGFLDLLNSGGIARAVLVGSRVQFEEMVHAIDVNGIKPVYDEKVFELEELKEACQFMLQQKHFGKLTIRID